MIEQKFSTLDNFLQYIKNSGLRPNFWEYAGYSADFSFNKRYNQVILRASKENVSDELATKNLYTILCDHAGLKNMEPVLRTRPVSFVPFYKN
jgi:hypothetical protein